MVHGSNGLLSVSRLLAKTLTHHFGNVLTCIKLWLLYQMHVPLCGHINKCVCVCTRNPYLSKHYVDSPGFAVCLSVCVLYVGESIPSICMRVCVCVYVLRDRCGYLHVCPQRGGEECHGPPPKTALLISDCCLCDLTLGDKLTSSIIVGFGAAVSYKLQ